MLPKKGVIFLFLNAVRVMSIVTLLLVFSAVVVLMVYDSRGYYDLQQTGDMNSYVNDYYYYPDTEVPTSTWGLFWLQLDRFNILLISVVCVASELSVGPMNTFFTYFLPVLGPSFGTAPLGVIQVMTSANLLAHYQEGFPLRVTWLLFFVGLLNLLCGVVFRCKIKLRRSLLRSNRSQWDEMQASEKGYSNSSPAIKKGGGGGSSSDNVAIPAWWDHAKQPAGMADGTIPTKRAKGSSQPSNKGDIKVVPIRTPLDAFGRQKEHNPISREARLHQRSTSALSRSGSIMLRERAREENMRVELQDEYRWHPTADVPLAKNTSGNATVIRTLTRSPSITEQIDELETQIKRGQAGVSRDLSSTGIHAAGGGRGGEREGIRAAFQRRSLVLSRVVGNVKRASVSATTTMGRRKRRSKKQQQRQSKLPALPLHYARRIAATSSSTAAPRGKPSAWIEVDKSAGPPIVPSATYRASNTRSTIYEDLGTGRTRYFTPIANQFSSSSIHAR